MLLCFFIPYLCLAENAENATDKWLTHLRVACRKVFSVKADIVQEVFAGRGTEQIFRAQGVLEMRRKGRLRITYTAPTNGILVTNQEESWYYNKSNSVAFHLPDGVFLGGDIEPFFFGKAETEQFEVVHLGGSTDPANENEAAVLSLVPVAPDPYIASLLITVHPQVPCIRRVTVVTHRGNIIRITLKNVQYNVGIGARRFDFIPPKRAIIIHQ